MSRRGLFSAASCARVLNSPSRSFRGEWLPISSASQAKIQFRSRRSSPATEPRSELSWGRRDGRLLRMNCSDRLSSWSPLIGDAYHATDRDRVSCLTHNNATGIPGRRAFFFACRLRRARVLDCAIGAAAGGWGVLISGWTPVGAGRPGRGGVAG